MADLSAGIKSVFNYHMLRCFIFQMNTNITVVNCKKSFRYKSRLLLHQSSKSHKEFVEFHNVVLPVSSENDHSIQVIYYVV